MKVKVPASAPAFDPVQGAPKNSIFLLRSSSAIRQLSEGETVLQSTTAEPGEAPCTRPSLPKMTSRDMAVSPTQTKTQSLFFATSAGVAQTVACIESAIPFALLCV